LTASFAIICEHLSAAVAGGKTTHPVSDRKAEDRYQLSEEIAMGEFFTVDVFTNGVVVVGALGFFFLGYQALQILKK
jgi:divalent metal cation (Fe/Co/Zn/Cd) transporter